MPGDWTKLIIGVGFWSLLGFWSKRGGQKEENLKKEQLYGRGFIYLKTNAKLFMVMKNTFPNEVKSSQYSTSRVCDQQRWGSKKSGRGSSNRIVPVGSSTHWCYLTFLILYRMAGASWGEATRKRSYSEFYENAVEKYSWILAHTVPSRCDSSRKWKAPSVEVLTKNFTSWASCKMWTCSHAGGGWWNKGWELLLLHILIPTFQSHYGTL